MHVSIAVSMYYSLLHDITQMHIITINLTSVINTLHLLLPNYTVLETECSQYIWVNLQYRFTPSNQTMHPLKVVE